MHTFTVSDVSPPKRPLHTIALSESLLTRHNVTAEASGSNLGNLVAGEGHPFLAAAREAFAKHYPLVLSPDDVWLCIAQGFGMHVDLHAEELRERFVRHQGQAVIKVRRDEFVKGSPDNDWPGCFTEFSNQIAKHVGKSRDLVVASFSTTGPVERAASEIVLMSTFQSYFQYAVETMCGIPTITLLGTVEDWRSVRRRAEHLREFGLSTWIDALMPVLREFVKVAAGVTVDRDFWKSFYALNERSGHGPYVTGWINVFFPYLEIEYPLAQPRRRVREPNPFASNWRANHREGGPAASDFPPGLSRAPFIWDYLGDYIPMTFLGGFVGVSQDPETWSVRPAIGWAVHDGVASDVPAETTSEEYWARQKEQYQLWQRQNASNGDET